MADVSLDDFFAKKDKSKKKSKSKMTPTDVLLKADEPPKKEKKKKDKEKSGGPGLSTAPQNTVKKEEEDEEWKDFEEQKEIDYTGLRIQTLQISSVFYVDNSREEEEREHAADEDEDGEGEDGEERRDSASGPWNKSTASSTPTAATPKDVSERREKKESAAPKKYIPPAQRQAAQTGSSNPIRRKPKEAPNIQSEEDFPTLGGALPSATSTWGAKSKYEDSGAGDLEMNPDQRRGISLTLENKYAALQD